ncbi:hypothetical protein HELRODRAFT_161790 [Helobdella robusta]|uniref:Uncharacterized protein n=1 Tax=Helobdella robusta TaxID=6412 RepID=T1ERX1_HELRO|nr:hypothetical protein HELRODRAFT_161790 [Helobdella robusta]ESO02512.1 hypothetical protein HELRODRAFT_161790 [Helobdella robusta]
MVNKNKIVEEVKLFCETVTIRGISRIVKSKQNFVAFTWSLVVMVCSGVLAWQLQSLIVNYFNYPFMTTITEQSEEPVFPTVTVCNLNPILMAKPEYTDILSWSQHLKNVMEATIKTDYDTLMKNVSELSKHDAEDLIKDLESPGGYFSNFPLRNLLDDSDSDTNLIMNYSFNGWDWMRYEPNVTLRSQWDSNYYKCYEIDVRKEEKGSVRSMSLILYINNFPSVVMPGLYQFGGLTSKATGVRIKAHYPGTRGDMKNGLSLSPGTESTFYIQMINRTRLHSPYNKEDCTDQNNFSPDETGHLYSREDCIEYCLQQQVVDQCNCVSIDHLFLKAQLEKVYYKSCGNMSNIGGDYNGPQNASLYYGNGNKLLPDIVKLLTCQKKALQIKSSPCLKKCSAPCSEIRYDYQGLYASWPDVTQHLSVYKSYVKNGMYKTIHPDLFKSYEDLANQKSNGTMNDTEIIKKLNELTLIKKNFLQVNIVFESNKPLLIEDKEMITPETMLSSIGGSLSLWLGITIMTLAELVEFIFNLIFVAFHEKTEKKIQPNQR